ncbi:MAG: FapA family protein [Desulfobacteraceae bacterium]|nr:FapA family protein [Desulfobacteraceae bacterium]
MKCPTILKAAGKENIIPEEFTHKILVVETTPALREKIHTLLTENGFGVSSFAAAKEALDALGENPASFTLIISSYMMPKMRGDKILIQAKQIAPETQRLLVVEASEMQTLVNAINFANIHACLTLPFQDEDVLNQVNHCCRQYETNQKQKSLLRLTRHQNKQLLQIAVNFKKKETLYAGQMEQKNKKIKILASRVHSGDTLKPVLLKDILDRWNIAFSQASFITQFSAIKREIKKILETAALSAVTNPPADSIETQKHQASGPRNFQHLVDTLLPLIYAILIKRDRPPRIDTLDHFFDISLSENNTKAFLQIKEMDTHVLNPSQVKLFLEEKDITHGIIPDHEIESYLFTFTPGNGPFLVAWGRAPVYPEDAKITYHFPTNFRHAGKIRNDGSIDFSDRGGIPHVEEDTLLAEKTFPNSGIPGLDVYGRILMVDEPVDKNFSPGFGTRLSEDGDKIYAAASGQPHLDALENLSVCPEYRIRGDLGFETGDVHFKGNVIVDGTIKPGFKITCATLTAKEINGAQIDITGDLNVSFGIVDATIVRVKGRIQAKFIHNSFITAFGDLIVQKEIMDSKIFLSGACINTGGVIINSEISAKMGIGVGSVGKAATKPSILKVGKDEQTNRLVAAVDAKLDMIAHNINDLASRIVLLEKEDHDLHAVISQHAYIQDRAELQIKDIESKTEKLKTAGNISAVLKGSNAVKVLQKTAKKAEADINAGFARQDVITTEIAKKKKKTEEYKTLQQELFQEKEQLLAFFKKDPPLPSVKVAGTIESGTRIFAAHSSIILKRSYSRCHIREVTKTQEGPGGIQYHEIQIT